MSTHRTRTIQPRTAKHVPTHIREARWQREKRRMITAIILWFVWLGLFIAGSTQDNRLGTALLSLAFGATMVDLAVTNAVYERTLRRIAGRPQADYTRIRKLEKKTLPQEARP